jgi:hypothetical protein
LNKNRWRLKKSYKSRSVLASLGFLKMLITSISLT